MKLIYRSFAFDIQQASDPLFDFSFAWENSLCSGWNTPGVTPAK
jgi:hypothetical protein